MAYIVECRIGRTRIQFELNVAPFICLSVSYMECICLHCSYVAVNFQSKEVEEEEEVKIDVIKLK